VETDRVNPAVGLADVVGLGTKVQRGDPLCTLHAADEDSAMAAAVAIQNAITIGEPVTRGPLILEGVT
jgi:thymidine phosphorylase